MFVKFAPAFFQACPLKVEKSAHMSSPSVSHQSAFLLPQKSHTSHIHPQTFPTIFYYIYVDLATIFYYFYYFLLFLTHPYLVFSTYCYKKYIALKIHRKIGEKVVIGLNMRFCIVVW